MEQAAATCWLHWRQEREAVLPHGSPSQHLLLTRLNTCPVPSCVISSSHGHSSPSFIKNKCSLHPIQSPRSTKPYWPLLEETPETPLQLPHPGLQAAAASTDSSFSSACSGAYPLHLAVHPFSSPLWRPWPPWYACAGKGITCRISSLPPHGSLRMN